MSTKNDVFSKFAQHTVWDFIIFRGIVALIIGVFFIAKPLATIHFLCIMIGIFLLINGLVALIKAMKSDKGKKTLLIYGLICLGAGILFFSNPAFLAEILVTIFALLILISGVNQIIAGIKTNATPVAARILTFLTGLFSIILGIILLLHLNDAKEVIAIIIGIYLVAFGILAIATGAVIKKTIKKIM